LADQIFWRILFQKRVVCTKCGIYIFIISATRRVYWFWYLRFHYSWNESCFL